MKICVTGGCGFTRAVLVERLLDDGHEISVIDKQPGLIDNALKAKGAQIIYASITDRDAATKAVEGCEVVQHLASAFREIGVPNRLYYDVNVEGTIIVTEESIKAGTRKLAYCSTQGVHGHIENPPDDENCPIAPADYYQQTKYEGEVVLHEYKGQIEYTILRPTAIYGAGDQ